MRDAAYHRATLDSLRQKLPHPERYRLVLAALLAFGFANRHSPALGPRIFQISMAGACFIATTWVLIDYTNPLARAGTAFVAWTLIFFPTIDSSSDLDLQLGLVAFVAAASAGGLSAIIDRASSPTTAAVSTRAVRDIRGHT